mmetsp:Transcript_547/g.571  ORF Transcript_547/g.571 Transcript_547/m.571 type:complete len:80 (-) Transcript_547:556-795(-)
MDDYNLREAFEPPLLSRNNPSPDSGYEDQRRVERHNRSENFLPPIQSEGSKVSHSSEFARSNGLNNRNGSDSQASSKNS